MKKLDKYSHATLIVVKIVIHSFSLEIITCFFFAFFLAMTLPNAFLLACTPDLSKFHISLD